MLQTVAVKCFMWLQHSKGEKPVMTLVQMIPIYCNLTLASWPLWTKTSAPSKQLKINTKPSNVKPIVIYPHKMESHFFIQPLKALLNIQHLWDTAALRPRRRE